jgi:Fic family protein
MLSGAGTQLPNPHILITPYLTKEAVLSSKIEGTQASLSDVLKYNAQNGKEGKKSDDIQEVKNYINALEHGLSRIKTSNIDYTIIKEMHKKLLEGVRGGDKEPGEFRKSQNWIGSKGTNIGDALYIPPAPEALTKPMYDFKEYLDRKDIPLLIQIALLHYHFEAMHPFRDGNGRMGRVIITLFLCKRKALSQPLLYLSAYFEKNRQKYYKRLLAVSQTSDYDGWVKFFLTGVKIQAEDSLNRAKKLTQLHKKYLDKLLEINAVSNAIKIIDLLFDNPYTTIPKVQDELTLNYPTAKKAIDTLVKVRIIKEITGKERYKLYCATEILDILEV